MTPEYPPTPPPELLEHWAVEHQVVRQGAMGVEEYIAIQTSRFRRIADNELKACCEWIRDWYGRGSGEVVVANLRAARRPKPPSLAEEALTLLDEGPVSELLDCEVATIRAALKRLQQLEKENNDT